MRKGFTLLELVFVIVIFGIMSKYGADILYKIYENYIYSNTFNRLQNQSEAAVKQIANRLQYRIKDSTIARDSVSSTNVEPIGSNTGNESVLEWIGVDIDGWRGTSSTAPDWSGFIDLATTANSITSFNSPGTNAYITGSSSISDDAAIFFIGSNVDLNTTAFGWRGPVTGQTGAMHPITIAADNNITANGGSFSGVDVYEYYQLSRTAYAVGLVGTDLNFYYNYQPWRATGSNSLASASKELIMENVTSFKFTSMGDIMIIQVCVGDDNLTLGDREYSICKEKVVF